MMSWKVCCVAWGVCLLLGGASAPAQDGSSPLEVWVAAPDDAEGRTLRKDLADDLGRTPRRHKLRFLGTETSESESLLAVLAVDFDSAVPGPRVDLARAGDELSPGWLVHAILGAGSTVGVEIEVVDHRTSWLGQLVDRSTRRREAGTADSALGLGVPAVTLVMPSANEAAVRLLAATVRRLDGLDGPPLFEDEFLVVARRVLLRRDLYWLGLALWLALYWRGRKRPGREFRWLLLAAWLVAPVYSSLLLALPAVVAAWRPGARWPAAVALLPAAVFGVLLAVAVAGPAALVVSGLPALLVMLALAAFTWQQLIRRPGIGDSATGTRQVHPTETAERIDG